MAGLTNIRCTTGSEVALTTAKWPGVQTLGSTSRRSFATTIADVWLTPMRPRKLTRAEREEMSATIEADLMAGMASDHGTTARLNRPRQVPALATLVPSPSREWMSLGWPQLRLRDNPSPARTCR
jgi:hypothetical protein